MAEGIKIVSALEMARIEGLALAAGSSEIAFMEKAAEGIATRAAEFIEQEHLPKVVTLLVGKGNNGGDAYAAGVRLLEWGFAVEAFPIYPIESCSLLCQAMHKRFTSQGGTAHSSQDEFIPRGLILDGLVGTGFHGKAEGVLALAIEKANASEHPILSIDIPSGLNGNTGDVESVAIEATQTIYLELPKIGFFLKKGLDLVGELSKVPFGLPEKFLAEAKAEAFWVSEGMAAAALPPIARTRHKYQAGYVLAVAGSSGMPGAALLSCEAALHSGAGIVRLFYPEEMEAELTNAPYELIREGWDLECLDRIEVESKRAKALILGPGIGRSKKVGKMVHALLSHTALPTVIDADALFFLGENPSWKLPARAVLTPHHQEMAHLLKKNSFDLATCQAFSREKQATIVLKGAASFIFHPQTIPLCVTRGDPGMATAGSGDVLTGVIGALLAQGLPPQSAAMLGVYLHGLAGECAADENTSYCMTASDLLHALPVAFMQLIVSDASCE